jgi:hypothetical protein
MADVDKAVQVNLRCTFEEERAIEAACVALRITQSHLVELSLIQASADLGLRLFDDLAPRLKPGYVWPWEPKRPDGESAKARFVAYVHAPIFPTIESAAWAVRLSVPLFAIGSSLRQVALLKLMNERRQKAEPKKWNAALAKIEVPYGFDALAKTHRD